MKVAIGAKEWFSEWFDSPYYHVLYRHRDAVEAQLFLDSLIQKLSIGHEDKILDLACGKGRHSIYLNAKGHHVTGVDLSANSIREATKSSNSRLDFHKHDMRDVFKSGHFDLVLNMFTSFGYLESKEENAKAILQAVRNLKPHGQMVLDFMNSDRIITGLVPLETQVVDDITFEIKRYVKDGKIVKEISFEAEGKQHQYFEKVMALGEADFRDFFERAGCTIVSIFGGYDLSPVDPSLSNRMIFWVQKHP